MRLQKEQTKEAIKTASKKAIQETAEATGNLIGYKITNKIIRVSKTSPKNNLETNEEEILRERFIPSELRQKIKSQIIDDLRYKII